MTRQRVRPEGLLVVHDDLDLPLGRLRFKRGGGAGGQKGVQDVIARIGPDFDRLKVGVSRPPTGWTTEHWVLSRFREDERPLVERVVSAAADAVDAAAAGALRLAARARAVLLVRVARAGSRPRARGRPDRAAAHAPAGRHRRGSGCSELVRRALR
ncbi:MAG: aminoacyl-tRNA hydrolase, partial [Acidimicrobiia bacterium]